MSILTIVKAPEKILKKKCEDVAKDRFGDGLDFFMSSMIETMYANNGVGLAGPQVGFMERVLVADMSEGKGQSSIKMVNPIIVSSSEETIKVREACLSVPGLEVEVERPWEVMIDYMTPFGEPVREKLSGYFSVVIQHEIDHLNGITLLEKTGPLSRRMYLSKIKKAKKSLKRALKAAQRKGLV